MGDWVVKHRLATGAQLHALVLPTGQVADDEVNTPQREIRVYNVSDQTLVVGSAQLRDAKSEVDVGARCQAGGVSLVRRQSGGGAVWLAPGQQIWIDVVVPSNDVLWHQDVGKAFAWLGEAWVEGLRACGVSRASVYDGAFSADEASRKICFATQGAGEVFIGNKKLVGLSQKRTRHATLFQTSAHVKFVVEPFVDLLDVDSDVAAQVSKRVTDFTALSVDPIKVCHSVIASISAR